jgi:hypothetical protein
MLQPVPPFSVGEQKLVLSCSFQGGQVYNNHRYDIRHTLLCSSSPTEMFNKPTHWIKTHLTYLNSRPSSVMVSVRLVESSLMIAGKIGIYQSAI